MNVLVNLSTKYKNDYEQWQTDKANYQNDLK